MEEEKKEEVEQGEAKNEKKTSETIKTGLKVALGIAFILLGLLAVRCWWSNLWVVIRGCLGPFLLLAGAITIAIAKE